MILKMLKPKIVNIRISEDPLKKNISARRPRPIKMKTTNLLSLKSFKNADIYCLFFLLISSTNKSYYINNTKWKKEFNSPTDKN